MGTQLGDLIISRDIELKDLRGRRLAVDSYNMIYQFVSTIRQYDGTLLMDSKGNITSHLSGLFFRSTKLMKAGISLAFVFDGKSPKLKDEEKQRRRAAKEEAFEKYKVAAQEKDVDLMKKYASRTAHLNQQMIDEAKELISALGSPIIDAPSEAEAQAAHMVKKGEFYGVLSQDADSLLFGSPKLIKNLSITNRKKQTGKESFQTISPVIIDLAENLNTLGIDIEQLTVMAMLCGTDFNRGGIKGIGPKKAFDLVKKFRKDFDALFKEAKWDDSFSHSWKEIYDTIREMPVTDDYGLKWGNIEQSKVYEIMVDRHEFNRDRIENAMAELVNTKKQKGLDEWF